MQVTIQINGRDALPVRAIPLLTDWRGLSPDGLAQILAGESDHWPSFDGLTAYRLHADGTTELIPPRWWESWVVRKLKVTSDAIKAKQASYETGYQEWRSESLAALPPGTFIWRDEFEAAHASEYGTAGQRARSNPQGFATSTHTLDFNPHPDHAIAPPALVLEGFERLMPNSTLAEQHLVLHDRLKPGEEWRGGRITDTDVLTLDEAARMATKHAGQDVTPADFLRAAGRGEIRLHAVVHRTARVRAHDGGVYCNRGEPNENIVPAGCIPLLPLSACKHLADAGRASWRTFDGHGTTEGFPVRYAQGMLADDEPDFQTVPFDCRVTGYNVRALADAFCDVPNAVTHSQGTEARELEVTNSASSSAAKPMQRSAAQDAAILGAIQEAGFNPRELPANERGKRGVKAEIREAVGKNPLFAGTKVFDKAWERLRQREEIADRA